MTHFRRRLLVCEVAVCFAPAAWALLISTFIGVGELTVGVVIRGGALGSFNYWTLLLDVGGILGLVGVFNVLWWLLYRRAFLRPRTGALALVAGVATAAVLMAPLLNNSTLTPLIAMFAIPIAAAAHLAYLARSYLLGRGAGSSLIAPSPVDDVSAGESSAHARPSWKAAAGTVFLVCLIIDFFPILGPPSFRGPPGNPVWNLGWPIPLYIYDPSNGNFYAGPATPLILPAQLVLIAIVLVVCLHPLRRRRAATAH